MFGPPTVDVLLGDGSGDREKINPFIGEQIWHQQLILAYQAAQMEATASDQGSLRNLQLVEEALQTATIGSPDEVAAELNHLETLAAQINEVTTTQLQAERRMHVALVLAKLRLMMAGKLKQITHVGGVTFYIDSGNSRFLQCAVAPTDGGDAWHVTMTLECAYPDLSIAVAVVDLLQQQVHEVFGSQGYRFDAVSVARTGPGAATSDNWVTDTFAIEFDIVTPA